MTKDVTTVIRRALDRHFTDVEEQPSDPNHGIPRSDFTVKQLTWINADGVQKMGMGDEVEVVTKVSVEVDVFPAYRYNHEKFLHSIAQRVHQAYHQDVTVNWRECTRGICADIHAYLEEGGSKC